VKRAPGRIYSLTIFNVAFANLIYSLNIGFEYFLFIYSHVHTLFGPFLPLPTALSLSPQTPLLPGRTCSVLISNFVEEKT
jgi:hypothetical protein